MIYRLNVSGIRIDILSEQLLKIKRVLKRFIFHGTTEPDIIISVKQNNTILIPENTIQMNENISWYCNPDIRDSFLYVFSPVLNKIVYQLQANNLWNRATIKCLDNDKNMMSAFTGPVGEILFRNRLLLHQGIVIHAAAIDFDGQGIMFTAPSGTGKSTQAKLWIKYRHARIINEDRPAIRVINSKACVFGTPWNGSSKKCSNSQVVLKAIVLLEQAGVNKIIKLNSREGITRLLPRCFLPYQDADLMKLAMDNLEKVAAITPVYLLKCRPDREAVEILYECIK